MSLIPDEGEAVSLTEEQETANNWYRSIKNYRFQIFVNAAEQATNAIKGRENATVSIYRSRHKLYEKFCMETCPK